MKRLVFGFIALVGLCGGQAEARFISAHYGDDDGFGIGARSGNIPFVLDNASPGEAPFTDIQLIGGVFDGVFPAFRPTGTFGSFSLLPGETIVSATLTLRTASFDSAPPIVSPNMIVLDGILVDPSFINGFSTTDGLQIETRSINLNSSFFAALSDGQVSLSGTRLTSASGSGTFEVDFMRLDITTAEAPVSATPEPASMTLLGIGGAFGLLGYRLRRRKAEATPTAAA